MNQNQNTPNQTEKTPFPSSFLSIFINSQLRHIKPTISSLFLSQTKLSSKTQNPSMEFFQRAKVVRLRSQHNKFLTASEDEESVKQTRHGSSKAARWAVEPVDGKPNTIRLKNCQTWKYLSASDDPFLLGMTGRKVLQASPRTRSDPSVEWEPLKQGSWVRLRTRRGNFLRANSGIPPWMNSVTHDVPSRSATQDWVLWMVDVLEVDYEAESLDDDRTQGKVGDVGHDLDATSTVSSFHSAGNASVKKESGGRFEEVSEIGSPAKSVHSSMEEIPEPSPSASPQPARISSSISQHGHQESHIPEPSPNASPQPARISSSISQHGHQESQNSSPSKLKSILDGTNDLLADDKKEDDTISNADSEQSSVEYTSRPHQLDVIMAKQTLKDLKHMEFADLLSSGRVKKLEKAISILVADAKMSNTGEVPKHLADLQDRINAMTNEHESASQELTECTNFSAKKLQVKAELKRDAAKAHELETMEVGFTNMLATARAKRDELLRQLEEVESSIRAAERTQADNAVEIEEIISRIGERSQNLREMEKEEKSVQERRVEAESKLVRVKEEWDEVKSLFEDV